jgi:hypothetical protein
MLLKYVPEKSAVTGGVPGFGIEGLAQAGVSGTASSAQHGRIIFLFSIVNLCALSVTIWPTGFHPTNHEYYLMVSGDATASAKRSKLL